MTRDETERLHAAVQQWHMEKSLVEPDLETAGDNLAQMAANVENSAKQLIENHEQLQAVAAEATAAVRALTSQLRDANARATRARAMRHRR